MTTDRTSVEATVIPPERVKVVPKPWGEEHGLACTEATSNA